jgi:hypothetical protein
LIVSKPERYSLTDGRRAEIGTALWWMTIGPKSAHNVDLVSTLLMIDGRIRLVHI